MPLYQHTYILNNFLRPQNIKTIYPKLNSWHLFIFGIGRHSAYQAYQTQNFNKIIELLTKKVKWHGFKRVLQGFSIFLPSFCCSTSDFFLLDLFLCTEIPNACLGVFIAEDILAALLWVGKAPRVCLCSTDLLLIPLPPPRQIEWKEKDFILFVQFLINCLFLLLETHVYRILFQLLHNHFQAQ